MKKIGLAVVGLGYWGSKLVQVFKGIEAVDIRALCDQQAKILEKVIRETQLNCPGSADLERLLTDDVQAVVVATPPAGHYEVVRAALKAGKHVFVEKPLAVSTDQVEDLLSLAQQKKVLLFTDHTFCYDHTLQNVRQSVATGALGKILHCRCEWLAARPKPLGPSVLWDSGPHALAALHYLLGVHQARVRMEALGRLPSEVLAAALGQVESDDWKADIVLGWEGQTLYGQPVPKVARVTLVGSHKTLVYEGSFAIRGVEIFDGTREPDFYFHLSPEARRQQAHPYAGFMAQDQPLQNACEAFINALQTGQPVITDGIFSARVVHILEAAERSLSQQGAWQTLV